VEEMYPVPVKVMVCVGEPATTPVGEIDVMVGAGLFAGVTGGVGVGAGVGELPPPLQPASRDRVRAEPTKNRR
jgi:hypothetical protein